jgi:hypothetical protein
MGSTAALIVVVAFIVAPVLLASVLDSPAPARMVQGSTGTIGAILERIGNGG